MEPEKKVELDRERRKEPMGRRIVRALVHGHGRRPTPVRTHRKRRRGKR